MSYTLTVTNHAPITIQNGATDNTTSLTLVGKNYPNYGQLLQQDLINLLQSWAGSTQPVSAVSGQLWFNTTTGALQVFTGASFKNVGGSTVSTTAPTATAIQGDTSGSKIQAGTGQLTTAWDSGELIVQTRNASFGLIFVGPTDAAGDPNAQSIPSNLRGWWLMEL